MRAWALSLIVLCGAGVGCGDDEAKPRAVADEPPPAVEVVDAAPELPSDPDLAIARLGAIPAWEAVVQRDWFLARRKQHGIVYGRLGTEILEPAPAAAAVAPSPSRSPPPSPPAAPALVSTGQHWLIDDTEGGGALAIRVAFGGAKLPEAGTRLGVGGAWALDDADRWYWKADTVTRLPPPAAPPELPYPPGHTVAVVAPPREGLRPVSKAIDNGVILFQVLAAPREEGEGWKIGDELGSPVAAILYFPGERPSYGGHDLRQPSERWQLKRAITYWVRTGKVRKKDKDAPATLNAVSPPARAW